MLCYASALLLISSACLYRVFADGADSVKDPDSLSSMVRLDIALTM